MNLVNTPTAASNAAAVWTYGSGRTLSSINTCIQEVDTINGSIPANTSLNFGTSAGKVSHIQAAVNTGAAGTTFVNIIDGTNTFLQQSLAANTHNAVFPMISGANVQVQLKNNDATNAGTYTVWGIQYS